MPTPTTGTTDFSRDLLEVDSAVRQLLDRGLTRRAIATLILADARLPSRTSRRTVECVLEAAAQLAERVLTPEAREIRETKSSAAPAAEAPPSDATGCWCGHTEDDHTREHGEQRIQGACRHCPCDELYVAPAALRKALARGA